MNYNYTRLSCPRNTGGPQDERFVGALLPFLAGVAVTTPFIFIAKNQNQPYYPYPPMPYQPMPYPPYPPMYPYRPY